jgi:3D (Asp-Asp-Asp) domain-containing protein
MEGGLEDMQGKPLRTLQQFLAGQASYVSVAMDTGLFPYGTELCIPQLEQKYNRQIPFRVVDTGQAFIGKGTTRIDICTANESTSNDPAVSGASLTLVSKIASKK